MHVDHHTLATFLQSHPRLFMALAPADAFPEALERLALWRVDFIALPRHRKGWHIFAAVGLSQYTRTLMIQVYLPSVPMLLDGCDLDRAEISEGWARVLSGRKSYNPELIGGLL